MTRLMGRWLLALVLVLGQMMAAVHAVDADVGHAHTGACQLCLLSSALDGFAPAGTIEAPPPVAVDADFAAVFLPFEHVHGPRFQARAPPV